MSEETKETNEQELTEGQLEHVAGGDGWAYVDVNAIHSKTGGPEPRKVISDADGNPIGH